jgi:hypothetical protein
LDKEVDKGVLVAAKLHELVCFIFSLDPDGTM